MNRSCLSDPIMSGLFHWFPTSTIALLSTLVFGASGYAAEQVTFSYPPFGEFSVAVNDLELFAKEGKITPDFAFYAQRLQPQQREQFRELLQQRFEFTPVYVSQFTYAPLVEKLLLRVGDLVQTDSRENGMKSLRSAMILAAADRREGLTAINVLRRFPGQNINLKLTEGIAMMSDLSSLLRRRDGTIAAIKKMATDEAAIVTGDRPLDLRQPGSQRWQKRTFAWMDQTRQRSVPGNLYLPQNDRPVGKASIPTVIISHGVAEDRQTFAYFAEHLASHGFAVAILEHTGGDANRLQQYLSGLAPPPPATELIDRPRDVSFLLDELQRQSTNDPTLQALNLQSVGLVGHSLGGYTVFALAGASIDFTQINHLCNPNRSFNLSMLLQCRASELSPQSYPLQDSRIKAIIGLNPLGSGMFGQQGISQIRLPTLLISGSDDFVTPAVPEQIYPFTWLSTTDKYLAILEKGTHFSVESIAPSTTKQTIPVPRSLIGPNPAIAQIYTKVLGLAFFQTHLSNQPQFRTYLNANYAQSISEPPMPLTFVQSTASPQITQLLQQNYTPASSIKP